MINWSQSLISQPRKLVAEYCFGMKELDGPEICIRIHEWVANATFGFTQSHHIKTPLLQWAYQTDHRNGFDTADAAVQAALESIVGCFNEAVGRGHQPGPEWFVPNANF